jgi:hypothetical protein
MEQCSDTRAAELTGPNLAEMIDRELDGHE